jgi:superfamily II DNA or RNA helicase
MRLRAQKQDIAVIVIVPSDTLQQQWVRVLEEFGVHDVQVLIVNTAIKNVYDCDLLVVDEVHMMVADTFSKIFTCISYKLILCLTGTLDRLDGKQYILKQYAPVCDLITLEEAVEKQWVAEFKQYKVYVEVDLSEYDRLNAAFTHHFSWFSYEFDVAMACVKDFQARQRYAKNRGCDVQDVTIHAMGFIRNMKARKAFVYDHPKKIEVANRILQAREDKKIITFTKSVEHAKLLCCGEIYHGKMAKKKKDKVMDAFNLAEKGILNSCQALNVGLDVQGINTVVIISGDSSSIVKKQRIGRSIRKEEAKVAEIWQLVLRGTVDDSWYRKASANIKTHTLDERQLTQLLAEGKYDAAKEEQLLFKL